MKKTITFEGMPHSAPLEAHAIEKLEKIHDFLKRSDESTPFYVELWLKAHKTHPHNIVELHLKTPRFDLNAHDEKVDIYVALDNAIDKIVAQLKKVKSKVQDKEQKEVNEKKEFAADKYTLSDWYGGPNGPFFYKTFLAISA